MLCISPPYKDQLVLRDQGWGWIYMSLLKGFYRPACKLKLPHYTITLVALIGIKDLLTALRWCKWNWISLKATVSLQSPATTTVNTKWSDILYVNYSMRNWWLSGGTSDVKNGKITSWFKYKINELHKPILTIIILIMLRIWLSKVVQPWWFLLLCPAHSLAPYN